VTFAALIMFEHKTRPILPLNRFVERQFRFLFYALAILGFSLGVGMCGYHFVARLGWVDALLNASMILTGMGPVNDMPTAASKLFASAYALYSGIVFLSTAAVFLAPAVHRLLHILQVEQNEPND
jgi:hypothetical protein